ncbi:MAG: cellulase family glycosylhydrolase [Deltaproteobacteria bacterium]|nr:cellulase family glycosylhydrolase [Deltaproteobacteria bacterium]
MELARKEYQHIRGFNYMPSYAFILFDVMDRFDVRVWDKEFGYARNLNANSLRIWVSSVSYHKDPTGFLRNFEKILLLANKHDLTIMPTLYNRWVDATYPFGQLELAHVLAPQPAHNEHRTYVMQFVSAFRFDPRIIMWDICNEPYGYAYISDASLKQELRKRETSFLQMVFAAARDADPSQPLTIGTCGATDHNDPEIYDLPDVLCCHPYAGWWNDQYEKEVDSYIDLANRKNKPLLCSETCQGSLDDHVRVECIKNSIGVLKKKGIGWYAWQLCAGEMVSARRDRTDNNAKPGDRGYMCFVLEDGSLRPGHEIIKELNKK